MPASFDAFDVKAVDPKAAENVVKDNGAANLVNFDEKARAEQAKKDELAKKAADPNYVRPATTTGTN